MIPAKKELVDNAAKGILEAVDAQLAESTEKANSVGMLEFELLVIKSVRKQLSARKKDVNAKLKIVKK